MDSDECQILTRCWTVAYIDDRDNLYSELYWNEDEAHEKYDHLRFQLRYKAQITEDKVRNTDVFGFEFFVIDRSETPGTIELAGCFPTREAAEAQQSDELKGRYDSIHGKVYNVELE